MPTIFGKKIGMTQIFAPDGATVPVTLVNIPEARITQIKTIEKDGYSALQIGTRLVDEKVAAKKITKPLRGHFKKTGVMPRTVYEIRLEPDKLSEWKVGDQLKIDLLKIGDAVQVQGLSKGRGFAGVVKRHHFKGGPASHGHKDNLRLPGSIGSGHPQHVLPGTRMAGHMGAARATIKNLEIIFVDVNKSLVAIKGALPGSVNGWVAIKTTGVKVHKPISERKTIDQSVEKSAGKDKKEGIK